MASLIELTDLIQSLLTRLPGVKTRQAHVSRVRCWIELTLDSWQSLHVLVYCSEGANIHLHSYALRHPASFGSLADPARAIAFQYDIVGADEDALRERLELLGAYLVWQHHAIGNIPTEEANLLLTRFHAAHVPRDLPD